MTPAVLRIVPPQLDGFSLDELAAEIRDAHAIASRHGMEAFEAHMRVGRALLEARGRFPGDRECGQWRTTQKFPFNRQRAWVLQTAAQHETEVRAVVTIQIDSSREPNIATAVAELRGQAGPKGCLGHRHERHPYKSTGWLCLSETDDRDEMLAWADDIAAIAEAHHEAFRRRPPGDGLDHGFRDWFYWPPVSDARHGTSRLEHTEGIPDQLTQRLANRAAMQRTVDSKEAELTRRRAKHAQEASNIDREAARLAKLLEMIIREDAEIERLRLAVAEIVEMTW